MKGDFSRWDFDPKKNFHGVLHQQGRVLLDHDWNEQTRITNHWQDQAGRDAIGPDVAAVPAHAPDGFKVQRAVRNASGQVELSLMPGRIWADGLLLHLPGEAPDPPVEVNRIATYLQPPIQSPPFDETSIAAGVRDAVILEVWREAVNGFQIPGTLIEPALGGSDTTERIHTAMALRLFRLANGETCHSIGDRLRDDFSSKGKLTVSLEPPTIIPGDCPVVEGGGYTGFEHHLYRIEMAHVNSGSPVMFKWSQFNGGLVGRGIFDATSGSEKVQITANLQPIITSGLNEFYLEAVEYDQNLGHWKVTYGAEVTLNSDNEIDLPATPMFGAIPATGNTVFFRLWNGIQAISAFPVGAANELRDGIRLEFEAAAGANYTPGDYWTFPVRAGEIQNPQTLIDNQPSEGIHHHRVPLAELNWNAARDVTFAAGEIEDCRDVFRPLTDQNGCCTYTVGDGQRSHGDFNSIAVALRHLPAEGGKICVLAGVHLANVTIANRQYIQISGCGDHTIVHPHPDHATEPIFRIEAAQNIQLDHMTLMAIAGIAIELEDPEAVEQASGEIKILHNRIVASVHAISIRVKNELAGDNDIWIAYNQIGMLDRAEGRAAIFTRADDVLIERNKIVVVPAPNPEDPNDPRGPDDPSGGVLDPCAKPQVFYATAFPVYAYLYSTFAYVAFVFGPLRIVYLAQGGIQIGGGSERVRIIENEIIGGWGNGVTLGSDLESGDDPDREGFPVTITNRKNNGEVRDNGNLLSGIGLRFERADDGTTVTTTTDATGHFSDVILPAVDHRFFVTTPGYEIINIESRDTGEFGMYHIIHVNRVVAEAFAFIYDVAIDRNMITNMGLAGIGVVEFFDLENTRVMITVEDLTITRNRITHCVQQMPAEIPSQLLNQIGFGGVALADCENAVIRENRIENNGVSHLEPVCGIFILQGDKIDISDNRILNNGPKLLQRDNPPARPGMRGGVVVLRSIRSRLAAAVSERTRPDLDGIPAIKVHDNVVVQPLGHALLLFAIGPVSVVNNQLTSQGVDFRNNPLALLAGTVLIYDLGVATDFIGRGRVYSARSYARTSASTYQPSGVYVEESNSFNLTSAAARYGQFTAGGQVMFNDNQVTLDLQEEEVHLAYSSILLLSLDDVSFCGNQSACYFLADIILTNTLIYAPTVRTGDNRFQEDQIFAFFSLLSWGIMNACTNNQGTHCIVALGNAAYLFNNGNRVLLTALCEKFTPAIMTKYGG